MLFMFWKKPECRDAADCRKPCQGFNNEEIFTEEAQERQRNVRVLKFMSTRGNKSFRLNSCLVIIWNIAPPTEVLFTEDCTPESYR